MTRDEQVAQHPIRHVLKTTAVGLGAGFFADSAVEAGSVMSRASFGSGAMDIKTHIVDIAGTTLLGGGAGAVYGIKEVRAAKRRLAGK